MSAPTATTTATSPYSSAPFNPSGEAVELLRSTGLVAGARWIGSPNCDARPTGVDIDLLVIHNISLPPRNFGGPGIAQLFTNTLDPNEHPYYASIATLRVSAHLLIRRSGQAIQFVRCNERAWHAGVSSWYGREKCNDFSVGIELEGSDQIPFTFAQYAKLVAVAHLLRSAYAIAHATGHSDIAPGRKTDPGPFFDWPMFRRATALQR